MKWEYLTVLCATIFVPLILSRDKNLKLYKHKLVLFKVILGVSVPFWIWDVAATARGHWSFNRAFTLGVDVLGLPLEEWLFFMVVAFVSVFVWESTKYFVRKT